MNDNHNEELKHFIGNNLEDVIARNWANDIRKLVDMEDQLEKIKEAANRVAAQFSEGENHDVDQLRNLLK